MGFPLRLSTETQIKEKTGVDEGVVNLKLSWCRGYCWREQRESADFKSQLNVWSPKEHR